MFTLQKNPAERQKVVLGRVLSKRDSKRIDAESTASKKDRHIRKTQQDDMHTGSNTLENNNVHSSSRYSMGKDTKQIHQNDNLVEIPTSNRHRHSITIISQNKNNARESTLSKKSDTAPIHIETPMNPIMIDQNTRKRMEKRESVDVAKQSYQSGRSGEKPATNRGDIASHSLISPQGQQHDITETSNFYKESNKTPMTIDNDTENMYDRVEQGGDTNIKFTTEPQKQNKTDMDNLKQRDLGDSHVSEYSLVESDRRSELKHNEKPSEKTQEETIAKKSVRLQGGIKKRTSKAKTEKTVKVKKGDVSEPTTLEHASGFSKLGVSRENFNIDQFLANKELQMLSGLQENEVSEIIPPNLKKNSEKNPLQTKKNKKKNSSREEYLDKVEEETPDLKTKTQKGTPTQLKIDDVSDPIEFVHVSGYTKLVEEFKVRRENVPEGSNILHEDIDEHREGTDQSKKEIHEARLENNQKVKISQTSKKIKTGKLKMSEIGDAVNFVHISGYTKSDMHGGYIKVDEKSENELCDNQIYSDGSELTDDDSSGQYKKKIKNGFQEANKNMIASVNGEIAEENPREVNEFSKPEEENENGDIIRYADNLEVCTQPTSKDITICQQQENSNAFPKHNSDNLYQVIETKLSTQETNARSSEHQDNHDVKQIQIIAVEEKPQTGNRNGK